MTTINKYDSTNDVALGKSQITGGIGGGFDNYGQDDIDLKL